MRMYILVSFWIGVFVFVCRLIELAIFDWPHEQKPKSIGTQIGQIIIGLAVLFWAGIILWL